MTTGTQKVALITGITGQDGTLIGEFLLKNGCEVHGIKRGAWLFNTDRIDHLYQNPRASNCGRRVQALPLTCSE